MASEIRANSITSRAGLSTVTMTDSGPMFSGITTFVDNSGFTFGVGGGTSIFTPATNILTLGTNNTEKVRIDANGNTNITGVTTAANFKTGVSNLHNAGLTLSGGQLDVGSNIKIGTAGVVTATSFVGSGANLTGLPAATTINSNVDSQLVTATGTANTLQGESGLTFNGAVLHLNSGNNGLPRIRLQHTGSSNDIFEITSGLSGVSNGGFGIRDIDVGAYRFVIDSSGNFGFNSTSPSAYALATFNSANGILLQGDGQSRILMRNNTGGTNEKMMDIQCNGSINIRTINDDYTTATTRAAFRTDGNFVVGNRVGTSSPSTNQPVAFHSARITPDTASSTLSNGVRCNLYVGSNGGWAAGDGGVIGMGGSRSGSAGQEAMWAYIKGSRQSGNGWEYAGKMELGTAEWGTYNTTKAVTIYGDHQLSLHGKDNTMMTFNIGGALRLLIEHTGGGNMRLRNHSSGSVTYSTSSDYRLKENETTINNALTTIKALKPYQFTWKHDNKLGQGFFAHEAQAVLPDIGVVSGTKDEVQTEDDTKHDGQWKKDDPIYQSVDYSKLVPLLTAALQELDTKVETLNTKVQTLEQDNIALRARVTNLEGN